MRPPEVLDHQAALLDFLDSGFYHSYIENFLSDMVRKGQLSSTSTGAEMCQTLRASLRVAQAFHVQSEMMPLLRAAAMDLDDTDYLDHSRLPAEHGFLMFNDPWVITDVWGKTASIAAIQWRHGSAQMGDPDRGTAAALVPGIWLTYYADVHDERDEITQDLLRELGADVLRRVGRFHVSHIDFLPYHVPLGPTERLTDEQYAQFATEGTAVAGSTPNTFRMVVGLFRLLNQVIVEVAEVPVDRATTRRMTRKNLPVRVQTIKLRRKDRVRTEEPHGEGHVDWQHQWPVRGHWAWRKCRHDHPLAEEYEKGWHARVYVAPYWKGPNDKPVRLTEKVWGLAQ